MLSTRTNLRPIALSIALLGGLIQLAVAVGIFFFPIIALCGSDGCRYTSLLSYLRLDMPVFGLVLTLAELALVAVPGASVLAALRHQNDKLLRVRCWLGGLTSLIIAFASWIFGLYFLPGGLLLLLAALLLTFSKTESQTPLHA